MNEKKLSKVFAYVVLIIALITIFSADVESIFLTENLTLVYTLDNNDINDTLQLTYDKIHNKKMSYGNAIITGVKCKLGECFSYDNTINSRVNSTDITNLFYSEEQANISVNVWFKKNDTPNGEYDYLFRIEQQTGQGYMRVFFKGTDNEIQIYDYSYSSPIQYYCAYEYNSTLIEDNNWHMITAIHNGSITSNTCDKSTKVYLDGVLLENGELVVSKTPNNKKKQPKFIGLGISESDNTHPYKGLIDEFYVWNRVLNDTEIQFLYNSGTGVQYPFEEIPLSITILNFTAYNLTNESISYLWNFSGDYEHTEFYLNSELKLNTTNSSIKGFNATNLMPDTEYFAELYVYANATVYDYANITNTTLANAPEELTTPDALVIVGNNISDLAGSIRLIMLITIFVLALYLPNYARDKFRYETFQGVKTMSLVLLILILGLLFYVDLGLPTGFRNLLALATAVFIFGNAVFGEEDSYENSLSRH